MVGLWGTMVPMPALEIFKAELVGAEGTVMHARLLHEEPPRTRVSLFARMSLVAPRRGDDRHQNIASRPRSGDLIVGIAGLAKPVDRLLVYSNRGTSSGANTAARNPFASLSLSYCFHRVRATFRRFPAANEALRCTKSASD